LNLILFIVLGGLRAYGLFGPLSVRMLIMLNFFLMWFLPFIFFTQSGRHAMGLKKVERPLWWLWGLLLVIRIQHIVHIVDVKADH
jgi:hypothetical protein